MQLPIFAKQMRSLTYSLFLAIAFTAFFVAPVHCEHLKAKSHFSQASSKVQTHTFEVYIEESIHSGKQSSFPLTVNIFNNGNETYLFFPSFNFEIVSNGGFIRTLEHHLPKEVRPNQKTVFICSSNDAYLLPFSLLQFPFPSPSSPAFQVTIKPNGSLEIANYDGSAIPAGGHTFNGQSVSYTNKNKSISQKQTKEYTAQHVFVMELLDSNAFPTSTTIEVPATVKKKGPLVTIELSPFSFQTTDTIPPNDPIGGPLAISGGSLKTLANFLPAFLRPATTQTVVQSVNGNFLNLYLDSYGNLGVTSASTVAGTIPTGTYTLSPQKLSFLSQDLPKLKLENFIIDSAFTNIAQFTIPGALSHSLRDSHISDNFHDILAFSWSSNQDQPDIANNVTDVYVCIGKVGKNTKVPKLGPVQRITFNTENLVVFDTAIAINRTNPKNLVLSFSIIDYNQPSAVRVPYASFSNHGGKPGTWSTPQPIALLDPTGSFPLFSGDCRGVTADKFGNFWYSIDYFPQADSNNPPVIAFYSSSDGGQTWQFRPVSLPSDANNFYDYPQIATGKDGQGNYGLWFVTDQYPNGVDVIAQLGFIPTTGLGQFLPGNAIQLPNFENQIAYSLLTVGSKGKVFIDSAPGSEMGFQYYADTLFVKQPGPLTETLVHSPKSILNTEQNLLPTTSYPIDFNSYFITAPNNLIYDKKREALYCVFTEQPKLDNQNMHLYMVLSFDEGRTWSPKFPISSTSKNNRGFPNVAFDPKKGTMIFSWYDSRNSPQTVSEQFFGSYIDSKKLDKFVRKVKRYMKKNAS